MSKVKHKISRSKRRFENIVWPEIQHWFGDGHVLPVESVNTQLADVLDTDAGVDWLVAITDTGVVTIASRVQKTGYCFETTTARAELESGRRTELQKRLEQLRRGMVTPTVTVHSYVKLDNELDPDCVSGELVNAAAHPTGPLYRFIDNGERSPVPDNRRSPWKIDGDYYIDTNNEDGNRFAVVPWACVVGEVPMRVLDVESTDSLPSTWQSPLAPRPTFGGESDA